jgi:hypothetical protein
MGDFSQLLAYLLSTSGLTILIVWPQTGPRAWFRESVLRRLLPSVGGEVLDCYICFSFWSGLALSPIWWMFCHRFWCWTGCLMTPYLFWIHLRNDGQGRESEANGSGV